MLTSDGRLPNSVLRGKYKQPKVYNARADRPICDSDIDRLREGVAITTVAQRGNNVRKKLTARTKSCQVERLDRKTDIQITLVEGRNRQIRKMLGALEYTVTKLQRVSFLGMALHNLRGPGDWTELTQEELGMLQEALELAAETNNEGAEEFYNDGDD